MKTYKIGNKIDCVIRVLIPSQIGDYQTKTINEPYTILKDVEASITYNNNISTARTDMVLLGKRKENLKEIRISNVELTKKILNLIYSKKQMNLSSSYQNLHSIDNKILINCPAKEIFNIYLFTQDGLENFIEKEVEQEGVLSIPVMKDDTEYLVYFDFESGLSYDLEKQENYYLSLDLFLTGNTNDETSKTLIRIPKCVLEIDKNLYFNKEINAVDLKFIVINDPVKQSSSFITLE